MGFGEGCRKDPGKVLGIGAGPGQVHRVPEKVSEKNAEKVPEKVAEKKCKNYIAAVGDTTGAFFGYMTYDI
jgi:hypothetical protein